MPKKIKNNKRKRGKHGGNSKFFNCNKERNFARDCTDSRKVLSDFNSRGIFVPTMLWLLTHIHNGLLIQEGPNML